MEHSDLTPDTVDNTPTVDYSLFPRDVSTPFYPDIRLPTQGDLRAAHRTSPSRQPESPIHTPATVYESHPPSAPLVRVFGTSNSPDTAAWSMGVHIDYLQDQLHQLQRERCQNGSPPNHIGVSVWGKILRQHQKLKAKMKKIVRGRSKRRSTVRAPDSTPEYASQSDGWVPPPAGELHLGQPDLAETPSHWN